MLCVTVYNAATHPPSNWPPAHPHNHPARRLLGFSSPVRPLKGASHPPQPPNLLILLYPPHPPCRDCFGGASFRPPPGRKCVHMCSEAMTKPKTPGQKMKRMTRARYRARLFTRYPHETTTQTQRAQRKAHTQHATRNHVTPRTTPHTTNNAQLVHNSPPLYLPLVHPLDLL